MTTPTSSLVDQQDAELEAQLAASQQVVSGPIESDLMKLTVAAIVAWELHQDDPSRVASLLTSLRQGIRGVRVAGTARRLHLEALKALELGVEQGGAQAGAISGAGPELSRDVRDAVETIEGKLRTLLDAAAERVTPEIVRDVRDLEAVLATTRQAVTSAKRTTAFVVTRSVADGVTAVAVEHGAERLWIGERDACVHCLAYFGLHMPPGEPFPAGLTFGRKPLKTGPVWNPGLHPHCRCRVVLWHPDDGEDYPAALKREAQRSIARGWSLETESNSTRVEAAGRLLARVVGSGALPKSVEQYALHAVRSGGFPRGRRFPR